METVTRPPLERHLNWVPETAPTPPRDHSKENHPPAAEPRKLPRKMRPRRKGREHHHHPGTSGSTPETNQSPRCAMSASVKHHQPPQPPQLLQHPQPPCSAANHNSARSNLLDQAELDRLYKPACFSLSKDPSYPIPYPHPLLDLYHCISARNPLPDLAETTSPCLTSPSTDHSDLIEITPLGRTVRL